MADETRTKTTETETQQEYETQEKEQPTIEELLARIEQAESKAAAAEANAEKYKNANDKLSREAAERKRADRANMSESEQKLSSMQEELDAWKERAEASEKENNHNKAISAYKDIRDDKVVESLIEAVSEADHAAIAVIINNEKKAAVKEAEKEWYKSRPQANAGTGGEGAITKEQFDNMSIAEKSKLYKENKAEYDRLIK